MNSLRCLSAFVALLAPVAAFGGDWAYWRGPEMNGISRETNLVSDWSLETGKNVLWTSEIGGRATPIVLNGRVYLNCRTPEDINDPDEKVHAQERVVCWDAATGELLWEDRFNVFQTDIPAPRVGWASMVGDTESGNVIVHSVSGIFRCYTPDGDVVWEHSLFEDFGKLSGYGGRTQTPIIDEDRVIVGFLARNWGASRGPGPKHYFYAFDKNTGELQWTSAPGGAPDDTTYTNPTIAVIEGKRMLICGNGDGGCYAMNARTGEKIWGFNMSRRGLNTSPVVDGHRVYMSHGEDNVDSLEFGRIECIDGRGTGDITETNSIWRVDGIKSGYAGLLVKDGILYVIEDSGNLLAFDAENGEQLWSHNLGTVGKGSPVWADDKLYVMEVNGNIHILKPSREGCETVSHAELQATNGEGMDEIYASPAIADGRIFFVTRDRTICIGNADVEPTSDPIPEMAAEAEPQEEIALIQLRPYEIVLNAGESASFELVAFDANGRYIKTLEPELEVSPELVGATADGATVSTQAGGRELAGTVSAKVGDLTATARIRVFPPLPWRWDFEEYADGAVPVTWINAFGKLKPTVVDGNTVMKVSAGGKGRPSHTVWMGPSTMSDYTVQADVYMIEEKRKLSSIGVAVERYNFFLKGNSSELNLQSWAPHLRMAKEQRMRLDPDQWYTVKLKVDLLDDGGADVKGKIWKRDEQEPEEWSIETHDPHANTHGSPGLALYILATTYFDNVVVTKDE